MSNKTSDKNVVNEERLNNFIEAYKQTKEQSFIVDSINKDFFFEFVDCLLAELEQKDKRIKELEKELISVKARQIRTMNNIDEETKAKIYDSFDKIFYDDVDKKQKLQAILDTEEFINKYDCGKYNDKIKLVIFLAKEQLEGRNRNV